MPAKFNDKITTGLYFMNNIQEAKRSQLIIKSKSGMKYKNSEGNRWARKNLCKIANTVKDYNKINMDKFWKEDFLEFTIKVEGETNSYNVSVEFSNILQKIANNVKNNDNNINVKCIYDALFSSINSSDIKINCSCPDFKYRFKVWATKYNYNLGDKETRPAKITNPNDNLGAACKHILFVLNNVEWLQKIASVINNYINYCKDNMEYNYSRFIFPKIYGMSYNKAVEKVTDNKLDSSEEIINLSNALGKIRGRIQPGSNKNPVSSKRQ